MRNDIAHEQHRIVLNDGVLCAHQFENVFEFGRVGFAQHFEHKLMERASLRVLQREAQCFNDHQRRIGHYLFIGEAHPSQHRSKVQPNDALKNAIQNERRRFGSRTLIEPRRPSIQRPNAAPIDGGIWLFLRLYGDT